VVSGARSEKRKKNREEHGVKMKKYYAGGIICLKTDQIEIELL
jgi:hypothetical protein